MLRGMRHLTRALAAAVCLLLLSGCGIPRDPDRTLEQARQRGELVVGVSPAPPHVEVGEGEPSGPGADFVRSFAEAQGLRIRWVEGSEEQLITQLEHHDIDVLLGGLTTQTPYTDKIGITRPYAEAVNQYGETVKLVLAVPIGENALVSAIERHAEDVTR